MIDEVVEPEFFSNALPIELQRGMLKQGTLVGLEPTIVMYSHSAVDPV
tara:strand:- start:10483 stop:10626 length:144 start_codon:yes stop_codon:yes gene_type:complete